MGITSLTNLTCSWCRRPSASVGKTVGGRNLMFHRTILNPLAFMTLTETVKLTKTMSDTFRQTWGKKAPRKDPTSQMTPSRHFGVPRPLSFVPTALRAFPFGWTQRHMVGPVRHSRRDATSEGWINRPHSLGFPGSRSDSSESR